MVAHKMRSSFLIPDYPILASGRLKRQPKRIEKVLKLKFNGAQSQIRSASLPCWTGDISWFQMSILPLFKTALNWRVAASGVLPIKIRDRKSVTCHNCFPFRRVEKITHGTSTNTPKFTGGIPHRFFPGPKNDSIFLAISTGTSVAKMSCALRHASISLI